MRQKCIFDGLEPHADFCVVRYLCLPVASDPLQMSLFSKEIPMTPFSGDICVIQSKGLVTKDLKAFGMTPLHDFAGESIHFNGIAAKGKVNLPTAVSFSAAPSVPTSPLSGLLGSRITSLTAAKSFLLYEAGSEFAGK